MATEGSTRKRKKKIRVTSDENVGSGWKSPIKLLSPIVHTKTIYLHDWWLIRPEEGEGIAVGGFTMRKEGDETVFCSDAIKERHDTSTLESNDGFIIFISGLMNTSVTEQNGFAPEVCSYFLIGFPINWDDFASQHAQEGSTRSISRTMSPDGSHTFSPSSFKDMPFLQKRDFLLSTHEDEDAISEYLSNDLLEKLKSALASSTDDITHDCDLLSTSKPKDFREKVKDKCTGLNLEGNHTRIHRHIPKARDVKLRRCKVRNVKLRMCLGRAL